MRVELGPVRFAVCWLAILSIHAAAAAYYAVVALFYWQLKATHLTSFLEYYRVGMTSDHFYTIGLVHAVCAGLHGVGALLILVGSLLSRKLSLHLSSLSSFSRFKSGRVPAIANHPRIAILRASLAKAGGAVLAATRVGGKLAALTTATTYAIRGGSKFLDVTGKYFDVALVCRELLEVSLQTAQAYKMSCLLPRATINRMYTGLIVFNCWATTLIRVFFSSPPVARLLSILLDCILDLVTSAGITLAIVQYYLEDYDWHIGGFWNELWADDEWFALAKNEFQVVFVSSWTDLATRVVFAVGALASLSDIKALLKLQTRSNRVQHQRKSTTTGLASVGPSASLARKTPTTTASTYSGPRTADAGKPVLVGTHSRLTAVASVVLAGWGFVLLVLHLHASSVPSLPQCRLQVQPWGATTPHCHLVQLDCDQLGISGTTQQVEEQWDQFDHSSVERVLVRHCSAFEMSALLRDFAVLNALKVYNTSVIRWGSDAAISGTSHPRLELVYLVRVTLPDGDLPDGLLSTDMVWTLKELTICVSNLRRLPDDLDARWPKGIAISVEISELSSVPDCLLRLTPRSLSLYGNPIESLPAAVFEIEGLDDLNVGSTAITELPHDVMALSSSLTYVYVFNTSVSVFWEWIDPVIERAVTDFFWLVYAGGSPYCGEFERVLNGSASNFSALTAELMLEEEDTSKYSMLMDVEEHWDTIYAFVDCDASFVQPNFPLSAEDAAASRVHRSAQQ